MRAGKLIPQPQIVTFIVRRRLAAGSGWSGRVLVASAPGGPVRRVRRAGLADDQVVSRRLISLRSAGSARRGRVLGGGGDGEEGGREHC